MQGLDVLKEHNRPPKETLECWVFSHESFKSLRAVFLIFFKIENYLTSEHGSDRASTFAYHCICIAYTMLLPILT